MIIRIRWRKAVLSMAAIAVIVLVIICFVQMQSKNVSETAFTPFEAQSANDKLLVYTFLDVIRAQSDRFYFPYYTISPTVAYYLTTVKEVKEEGNHILITFSTLPYIGPHDSVGEDEITFSVSHTGEITLITFHHLKSNALPDHLSNIEKGALPPVGKYAIDEEARG